MTKFEKEELSILQEWAQAAISWMWCTLRERGVVDNMTPERIQRSVERDLSRNSTAASVIYMLGAAVSDASELDFDAEFYNDTLESVIRGGIH